MRCKGNGSLRLASSAGICMPVPINISLRSRMNSAGPGKRAYSSDGICGPVGSDLPRRVRPEPNYAKPKPNWRKKGEGETVGISRQYLELKRAVESFDVAANSVEAAKAAYESAQRQFKAGAALSEQVLDAQHAYRKAQAHHTQAVADYQIACAGLLQALGQIWRK